MSLNLDLPGEVGAEDDYDLLPEPIKFVVDRQQYLWLSDTEKERLIQDECEPEC